MKAQLRAVLDTNVHGHGVRHKILIFFADCLGSLTAEFEIRNAELGMGARVPRGNAEAWRIILRRSTARGRISANRQRVYAGPWQEHLGHVKNNPLRHGQDAHATVCNDRACALARPSSCSSPLLSPVALALHAQWPVGARQREGPYRDGQPGRVRAMRAWASGFAGFSSFKLRPWLPGEERRKLCAADKILFVLKSQPWSGSHTASEGQKPAAIFGGVPGWLQVPARRASHAGDPRRVWRQSGPRESARGFCVRLSRAVRCGPGIRHNRRVP